MPAPTPRDFYVSPHAGGHSFGIADQNDPKGRDVGLAYERADADRIVASLNACEGFEDPAALRRERDLLLNACRRIEGIIVGAGAADALTDAKRIARMAVAVCDA